MTRIQKKYGYILISSGNFGCSKIEEFVIYPEFRGKGYARKLAQFLPEKCYLIPYPLFKLGKGLNKKDLICFYRSLGFRLYKNSLMVRKTNPIKIS